MFDLLLLLMWTVLTVPAAPVCVGLATCPTHRPVGWKVPSVTLAVELCDGMPRRHFDHLDALQAQFVHISDWRSSIHHFLSLAVDT